MITDCKTHSGRYIKYTGITKAYIEEVRNYDVISPQEQKRLLSLAHSSDNQVKQEAINRLVQSNQRFIISFAKKWSQEDNEYIAPLEETTISKCNIKTANLYDTFEQIQS